MSTRFDRETGAIFLSSGVYFVNCRSFFAQSKLPEVVTFQSIFHSGRRTT